MSDTFTGRRSTKIWENERGGIRYEHYRAGSNLIEIEVVQDLKQFFLHERDKELGRWRDPERPNRTVAFKEDHIDGSDEHGRFAVAYDEQTMMSFGYWGHSSYIPVGARETEVDWAGTLERFFAAHPEPRPWHDAKPGEVWEMTFTNGQNMIGLVTKDGECFVGAEQELTVISSTSFTVGRRIWPEVTP